MKLNDFLRSTGISMSRFAEQIGTTTATVSRIADGSVVPRKNLLIRIFEVTGGQVTPNDLTGIHPLVRNDRKMEKDQNG
jgi:transcriptional regulator with XRE-family HTH domain